MNSMSEDSNGGGQMPEPEIIILGVGGESFYLYKGDEHLDEVLVDGDYPKPVLCVNFNAKPDVLKVMGEGFSLAKCWAIHPNIIDRLRDTEHFIETDA